MFTTTQTQITTTTALPEHAYDIAEICRRTYEMTWAEYRRDPESFQPEHIAKHIERFPQGQFVALSGGRVVGYAITLLTRRSPHAKPLPWLQAIGGLEMREHDRRGDWLYGVDFAVHPDYRRRGIGTQMYRVRFDLVKQLNLRGFYAGGMLVGYADYADQMSVREYGEAVIHGAIKDPTVSMQMNRGFQPRQVIERYTREAPPDNHAMLIVWSNPHYGVLTQG